MQMQPQINQPYNTQPNSQYYQNQPQQPEIYEDDRRQSLDYEFRDNIESYGSIIKDLTDTEKLLEDFELKLRGKMKMPNGDIVKDPIGEVRIKSDRAARDFVEIIRSVVNRHNDFSYYEENEAYAVINGANDTICRWLMLQGEEVPTRYRYKISFEAMGMISASMHKAMNGRMLTWTKGTFREGLNINNNGKEKKGMMDYIFPFMRKNR